MRGVVSALIAGVVAKVVGLIRIGFVLVAIAIVSALVAIAIVAALVSINFLGVVGDTVAAALVNSRLAVSLLGDSIVLLRGFELDGIDIVVIILLLDGLRSIEVVALRLLIVRTEDIAIAIIVLLFSILLLVALADVRHREVIESSVLVGLGTEAEVIEAALDSVDALAEDAVVESLASVSVGSDVLLASRLSVTVAVRVAVVADVVVDLVLFLVVTVVLLGSRLVRAVDQNGGGILHIDITGVVAEDLFAIVSGSVHVGVLHVVIVTVLLDALPLVGKIVAAAAGWGDESDNIGVLVVVKHLVVEAAHIELLEVLPVRVRIVSVGIVVAR